MLPGVAHFKRFKNVFHKRIGDRANAVPAPTRWIEPQMRRATDNGKNKNQSDSPGRLFIEQQPGSFGKVIFFHVQNQRDHKGDNNQRRKNKMERTPREDSRNKSRIRKRKDIRPYIRKCQPLAYPAHDFVVRCTEHKIQESKNKRNNLDYSIALAPDKFRDAPKDESHGHDKANFGIQRIPQETIEIRN